MDTKLKNIKYKTSTKVVAVLLAALLFFVSGYSASMFLRGFLCYQSYVATDFTETEIFRQGFNRAERALIELTHYEQVESAAAFAETAEGKWIVAEKNNQIKEVETAFSVLDKSGIIVFRTADNRYRYKLVYMETNFYFSYDGSLISCDEFYSYEYISRQGGEATTQAAETAVMTVVDTPQGDAEVTQPVALQGGLADYYPEYGDPYPEYIETVSIAIATLNSIGSYTCYGEASKEAVIAVIEEEYNQHLTDHYHWWIDDYYTHSSRLENTPSFRYAAVNRKTGSVITNSNVLATDSAQQIVKKLGGVFAEYCENEKYVIAKGKSVDLTSGFYGELKEIIDGYSVSAVSSGINEEYDYYFSYAPQADIADNLTVSERIYNSYANNILKHPTHALIAFAVSFILACAACFYLLGAAGEREDGSVKLLFFDKVPFAITLVFALAVMAGCVAVAALMIWLEIDLGWSPEMDMFDSILTTSACTISESTGVFFAGFFLVFCGLSCSIARNIRNKTFFRHTLCHYIFKPFKWFFGKIRNRFNRTKQKLTVDYTAGESNKKFRAVALLIFIGAVIINALFMVSVTVLCANEPGFILICVPLWLIFSAVIVVALYGTVVALDRIMAGVSQIKLGKLTFKINTEHMPPFMKNFAKDIETIGEGLENAVESAVRDQRMKAELITNVSHDLKTPLTSIVNYVDLLKRCEIEDEDAKKYVSILDEKSQRMKKLIEDLVEASKASSGAIEIQPIKINLCELAAQTVGEHTDELKGKNIEIMLKTPQNPVYVMADAQKTSRIFENLFSNIRKYALEGTRVYFEVIEEGAVSIKNISKYPLDVPANELMRRFVRGDASRSGEGSGLGLSIAQNLCELQGGRFGVYIDGDLFKVTVELPLA